MPSDQKQPGAIRRIVSYPSTSVRPEENRLRREGATMGALGVGAGAFGVDALRQGEKKVNRSRKKPAASPLGERPVMPEATADAPLTRGAKAKARGQQAAWEVKRVRQSNPATKVAAKATKARRVITAGSKTKSAAGAAGLAGAAALYGRHAYTKGQPNRSSWYG